MTPAPLPWFVQASLAVVSVLSLPSYIGLVTKTKVWCALTGKCEVGSASYGESAVTAIFTTLVLIVLWYIVIRRKRVLLALTGGSHLLAFLLMSFFFGMNTLQIDQPPTRIDVMLLSAMLFVGCSLSTFAMHQWRRSVAVAGDAQSSG